MEMYNKYYKEGKQASPGFAYRNTEVVKTDVQYITPNDAADLLDRNIENRNISSSKVAEYARYMHRGQWSLTGQPVIVSDSGRLLDGQHRMQAVLNYGAPVQFLIVTVQAIDGRGELTPNAFHCYSGRIGPKTDISSNRISESTVSCFLALNALSGSRVGTVRSHVSQMILRRK